MNVRNLAENIYNGNISLNTAKKQREIENMLESFINYNPIKDVYIYMYI